MAKIPYTFKAKHHLNLWRTFLIVATAALISLPLMADYAYSKENRNIIVSLYVKIKQSNEELKRLRQLHANRNVEEIHRLNYFEDRHLLSQWVISVDKSDYAGMMLIGCMTLQTNLSQNEARILHENRIKKSIKSAMNQLDRLESGVRYIIESNIKFNKGLLADLDDMFYEIECHDESQPSLLGQISPIRKE